MNVYVQMDHPSSLNPLLDTTLLICHEAQNRGFQVFFFSVNDITVGYGNVSVIAYPMRLSLHDVSSYSQHEWLALGQARVVSLVEGDVVLMRQNPPFDMSYVTATYFLDLVKRYVRVVNDPSAVRDFSEKISSFYFHDLMPPTIITRLLREAEKFREHYYDIVLKPLYEYGGSGVVHISAHSDSFYSTFNLMLENYGVPLVVQKYLPEVREGDKRIFLLDGEPVGAYMRVPHHSDFRSNMNLGSTVVASDISESDLKICQKIAPFVREKGLFFAGIDIIDGFLVEINVTSPGGIAYFNKLNNIKLEKVFWDKLLQKYK